MPPSKIEAFAEANRGRQVFYKTDRNFQGIIVGWNKNNIIIYRGSPKKINLIENTIHDYEHGHLFITKAYIENYSAFIYEWHPSCFNFIADKKNSPN